MSRSVAKAVAIFTPGGNQLHKNRECPAIRDWVGLPTSPYVRDIDPPTTKAGWKVCAVCLPAHRLVDNWVTP